MYGKILASALYLSILGCLLRVSPYNETMDLLTLDNVGYYSLDKWVLHPLSISVSVGEKLAIIGETGSGKSTLLKLMAGLLQAGSGKLYFKGKKVEGPLEKLIPGHPRIGYLSQHFELHNNYQVFDLLEYANKLSEREADLIYQTCDIAHLLRRKTHQLSGGEKQRIALARILTMQPELILLDEPYSNLDGQHRTIMKQVLLQMEERLQLSCFMVSHDAPDILSWASRILVLQEGKMIQEGSPEWIYQHPANAYVAGLLGKYNLVEGPLRDLADPVSTEAHSFQIIRPEQLRIAAATESGLAGTITRKLFHGVYYEYVMQLPDGTTVAIFDMNRQWRVGDTVKLIRPLSK